MGNQGVAQLWDTESYEPLGHSFSQDNDTSHQCVSFSPDGRYLAYGGNDNKVTLWIVHDIVPQLALTSMTKHRGANAQEETESPSSSCLDVSILTFTHRLAHMTIIGRCYSVGGK
jgi:WD40 repeat protein